MAVEVDEFANQLSLEVIYHDVDVIQLECRVAVSGWSGIARAYTTQEDLQAFAGVVEQFGQTLHCPAAWEAGAETGIGLIGLRFYIIDRSGHIRCHVRLASQSATWHRPAEIWRFASELPTEAGLVIAFAEQLARIAEEQQGQAVLVGILA